MSNRSSTAPIGGPEERRQEEKRRRRKLRGFWRDFNKARKRICGDINRGESLRSQLADAVRALRDAANIEGFENIVGDRAATSLRDGLGDLSDFLQDTGNLLGNLNQACNIMERMNSEVGQNIPEPSLLERIAELSAVQKTVGIVSLVGVTSAVVVVAVASAGDGNGDSDGPGRPNTRVAPTNTPTQPIPPTTPPAAIPPLLPDLAVSISDQFNIECDRTVAIICTMTLSAVVENVGDADLPGPATVLVTLDNGAQDALDVDSLAPGQRIVIDAEFQDNFRSCFIPGCLSQAEVDAPGRIAEHTKVNNTARTTLFLPDLTVADILELSDNAISGVRVRVANVGEGPTRAETELTVTIAGVSPALRTIVLLNPGQAVEIEMETGKSSDCPESGCDYTVRVDALDRIFESDEANNEEQFAGVRRIQ